MLLNNPSNLNEPMSNKNSNRQMTSVGKCAKKHVMSFDGFGELRKIYIEVN